MPALIAVLSSVLGCSSPDLSGPGSPDSARVPWRLELSANAITMDTLAPYDTLQLAVTLRAADGTPLTGAPMPTYASSDSGVRVSPTGLLTARAPRAGVVVVASVVYQGIRLTDTAVVAVTASTPDTPPPVFETLALTLLPGDSAAFCLISCGLFTSPSKPVQVAATDAAGDSIPLALVVPRVTTGAAAVSSFDAMALPGGVYGSGMLNVYARAEAEPGPVVVTAVATVYGVTRHASLPLRLVLPLSTIFQVTKHIPPGSHTAVYGYDNDVSDTQVIGPGGTVLWVNMTGDSLDVQFDTPAAALPSPLIFFDTGGGNIPAYVCDAATNLFDCVRVRRFDTPGTYTFHSAKTGVHGTIVVRDASP